MLVLEKKQASVGGQQNASRNDYPEKGAAVPEVNDAGGSYHAAGETMNKPDKNGANHDNPGPDGSFPESPAGANNEDDLPF